MAAGPHRHDRSAAHQAPDQLVRELGDRILEQQQRGHWHEGRGKLEERQAKADRNPTHLIDHAKAVLHVGEGLEVRGAQEHASINKGGRSQSNRMAVEVHVKDAARFKGGWGFFGFSGEQPASLIPQAAACYACHQDHAAVDTTFVQFYPTLLPVSTAKATLSAAYLAEEKAKAGTK